MRAKTHLGIDNELCGTARELEKGRSLAAFTALPEMAADLRGLVHGGFVFGLADYAAMLAVNDPNVVLGSAETKFLKPVRVGEKLSAEAKVREEDGRKRIVEVTVSRDETLVMTGVFVCFVLEKHVLD